MTRGYRTSCGVALLYLLKVEFLSWERIVFPALTVNLRTERSVIYSTFQVVLDATL